MSKNKLRSSGKHRRCNFANGAGELKPHRKHIKRKGQHPNRYCPCSCITVPYYCSLSLSCCADKILRLRLFLLILLRQLSHGCHQSGHALDLGRDDDLGCLAVRCLRQMPPALSAAAQTDPAPASLRKRRPSAFACCTFENGFCLTFCLADHAFSFSASARRMAACFSASASRMADAFLPSATRIGGLLLTFRLEEWLPGAPALPSSASPWRPGWLPEG